MDRIFDRLGDLFRSFLQDEEQPGFRENQKFRDPDMADAWEELNDYLNDGTTSGSGTGRSRNSSQAGASAYQRRPSGPPIELAQDYRNLELDFGASFTEVKKAHKRLLIKHHPDRFAGNTEKQKVATEITQKINQSFQRLKKYHETGKL